ncbi:transposase [Caloranaerobacter azorensis]|uniref:transposase n=1 Tax=Caloranaerobacter azorensis TaxID=116090 RepID=UPI00068C3D9C|nr:transposase [Caloranaerobacter azorensis]
MRAFAKQMHFSDFFEEFDNLTEKPNILELFEQYIDIRSLIPYEFYQKYYNTTGHPREYPLEAFVAAFIFKMFFSIPTVSLLITLLNISKELREACGFTTVPHKSQFSRFLINFYNEIYLMFHKLVDITEPICREIDPFKASILISDTTGFEGYVKENNPKFFEAFLKASKEYAKMLKEKNQDDDFDVYKHAYSKMPKKSSANPDIKLSYLNGHFGYYIKSNIVTNGLGIIRHIDFYEPKVDSNSQKSSNDSPKSVKDK